MNVYELKSMPARLEGNTYPGRGIVVGKTADGKHAAFATASSPSGTMPCSPSLSMPARWKIPA